MRYSPYAVLFFFLCCLVQAAVGADPAFRHRTHNTVDTGGRSFRAQTYTMTVPVDYGKPHGETLSLPVVIIRSPADRPQAPVFWLNGGPGTSNVSFKPTAALLARHDFIMVGYRGVDGSVRLDAPRLRYNLKGDGRNILSEKSLGMLRYAVKKTLEEYRGDGIDVRRFTVRDVVRDIDAARGHLGYEQINLLSTAYGSRPALFYDRDYPGRVNRSVIIGANPPGGLCLPPESADTVLRRYASLYRTHQAAQAPERADLYQTVGRVTNRLPSHHLFVTFDRHSLAAMGRLMLSHTRTAPYLFAAYESADRGDFSGLAMVQMINDRLFLQKIVWGDYFAKAVIDYRPDNDYLHALMPESSLWGNPLSAQIFSALSAWPSPPLPANYNTLRSTPTPTLVLTGKLDPKTSQPLTRALMSHLKRGRHLRFRHMGHFNDIWSLQPEAASRLLVRFFRDGTVDRSGFQPTPVDFDTNIRLRTVMSLMIIVPVILLVLVLLGVFLFIRRLIRRRKPVT